MSKPPQNFEPRTTPVDSTRRSLSATEAQNSFGQVLGNVARGEVVVITRYDRPEAVVLSMEKFEALTGSNFPDLDRLTREFDERLAQMQTAEAAASADAFFELGSEALSAAARRGAQRRPM